jgi:hypothetical protein
MVGVFGVTRVVLDLGPDLIGEMAKLVVGGTTGVRTAPATA